MNNNNNENKSSSPHKGEVFASPLKEKEAVFVEKEKIVFIEEELPLPKELQSDDQRTEELTEEPTEAEVDESEGEESPKLMKKKIPPHVWVIIAICSLPFILPLVRVVEAIMSLLIRIVL